MKKIFEGLLIGIIFVILFFNNPAFAFVVEQNIFFEENFLGNTNSQNNSSSNNTNPNNTNPNNNSSNNSGSMLVTSSVVSNNASQSNNSQSNNSQSNNSQSTTTQSNETIGFSCDVSSVSPLEARAILDLTKENFSGTTISDDKNEKAIGVDLNSLELISESGDGETAVTQSAPSRAATADRFSYFDGRVIDGPFGVGLVLEDTLRVGRCVDTAQENCRVYGNGLTFRTSGKGISNMVISTVDRWEELTKQVVTNVSEEELVKMQNMVYDQNDLKVQIAQLSPSERIQNSFRTESYVAKSATNCNNNSCIISSYSAFDKLFNQWFSTDMIITNFGPVLLNSVGRWMNLNSIGPDGGASKVIKKINEKIFRRGSASFSETPGALIGKSRIDNYNQLVKKNGFGDLFTEFTVGNKAFSSGAAGYTDELLNPNSPLFKLTPDQKKDFFKALQDIRAYSELSVSQMNAAQEAFKNSPGTTSDLIDYAKDVAKQIKSWDDVTFLDFPAWVQKNPELTGLQGFAFKKTGFPDGSGFVDLTSGQTFNFTNSLLAPFAEHGNWDSFAGATASFEYQLEVGDTLNALGNRGIKLFRPEPSKVVASNVSVNDLSSYLSKLGDALYTIEAPGVGQLPLNAASIERIRNTPGILGNINVYSSQYTYARDLNPEEFANILVNKRIVGRPATAARNYNDLLTGLKEHPDFVSRKAWGPLDAVLTNENKIIKDYFTLKANTNSFYKIALGPTMVWNVKRGLGSEKFSAFMLPDSWSTITINQGVDDVYKDSFTDFFANEGSDQGELFSKVINSMIFYPNTVIKAAADSVSPQIGDKLRAITGEYGLTGNIMRDEVMNLAFYSHNENCSGCTVNINKNLDDLRFDVYSPVNIKSFLVEAVDPDTANKKGSSLIAYTHGSNLQGVTGDIEGQEVNLVRGRIEGTTCEQVLRDNLLGWSGRFAGLVAAGSESAAYAINPGFGMLVSGAQQVLLTPKLQDCVDDKEGYYVHFYVPPALEQKKGKTQEVLSSENITSAISDLSNTLGSVSSDGNNPVSDSMEKMKDEFQKFADQANNRDILQATISLLPPSTGSITGKEVFYIWFKETLMPTALKTEGVSITSDGNTIIEKNYDEGSLLINDKKVIDGKKEIVGLITQDNRLPAEIIPKTVSTISMPNNSEIVFELNVIGELRVREEQVKKCIQEAVKKQTGLTFTGDELTQVFGNLRSINTTKYGSIFASDRKIVLEGDVPFYGTINSRFVIDGYWDSRLIEDANKIVATGKFIGMAFEHGSIVLNPETSEIVIWLRQHKESVLTTKDVSGLKPRIDSIIDPETECEQPAINLDAQGYPNDELGMRRVANFNTSMEHLGPFTQFTTDNKVFLFYSTRNPETGECVDYFRVIDKDTGKILIDSPIIGGITQGDDGKIKFQTADGKTHVLDFQADNGVPKISYNNGPSETLRTAQGPNGSFWFDPNTGLWYPENGLQIPLNQNFKDQGAYFGVDKEGNVSGTAGNPMTFNIGGQQSGSGFNIPSLPENVLALTLFVSLYLIVSFILTQQKFVNKKRKK